LLFVKHNEKANYIAIASSGITFALALNIAFNGAANFDANWIQSINARFVLTTDGLAKILILLTGISFPAIFMAISKNEIKNRSQFLSLMLLTCTNKLVSKSKIFNFLHDYVILHIPLFDCIKKYYSNVLVDIESSLQQEHTFEYNCESDSTFVDIDFIQYKKLFTRLMLYHDFHGNYGDKYIQNLFKTQRFVYSIENYISENKNCVNEYLLCIGYANMLASNNSKLDKIFQYMIKFKMYHKISTYEILTAMNIFHFYTIKVSEDYDYNDLAIICLYLTNFHRYDFTYFKSILFSKSSKKDLYKFFKKLLFVLYNN